MTALHKEQMTASEFLGWARAQPDRWELFDGVPTAMSPERVIHGDTKYRAARALDDAIARARVPCRFVLDSAAVRVDARNTYQQDVLVYSSPKANSCSIRPEYRFRSVAFSCQSAVSAAKQ